MSYGTGSTHFTLKVHCRLIRKLPAFSEKELLIDRALGK